MAGRAGGHVIVSRPWGVFLDRDGTLLRLVSYLHEPDRVRLYAGVGPALRALSQAGARLVVVTNQSGVARGYFSEAEVRSVHRRMNQLLMAEGVRLDAIEICPHHPDFGAPCACRKPGPAMLQRAARKLGIDLKRSWTVGDSLSDLRAGRAAGTMTGLLGTGYGRRTAAAGGGREADLVAATLPVLVRKILDRAAAGPGEFATVSTRGRRRGGRGGQRASSSTTAGRRR